MTPAELRLVEREEERERVHGSRDFIALTRNPALSPPPRKFVPTVKADGDVVI